MQTDLFNSSRYLVRRKVLKVLGAAFHIYEPDGRLAFYSQQKAFKLKEDIRLYTDESMSTEALVIKARQILDFSAAYDVVDPASGEKVGALKRQGFKSILKDEWIIMDPRDNEIGSIQEDSMVIALVRRFIIGLIPQSFHVTVGGAKVGVFKQNFNPFVSKIDVDLTLDRDKRLDRRLALAAAVLLCAIEGKQQ